MQLIPLNVPPSGWELSWRHSISALEQSAHCQFTTPIDQNFLFQNMQLPTLTPLFPFRSSHFWGLAHPHQLWGIHCVPCPRTLINYLHVFLFTTYFLFVVIEYSNKQALNILFCVWVLIALVPNFSRGSSDCGNNHCRIQGQCLPDSLTTRYKIHIWIAYNCR